MDATVCMTSTLKAAAQYCRLLCELAGYCLTMSLAYGVSLIFMILLVGVPLAILRWGFFNFDTFLGWCVIACAGFAVVAYVVKKLKRHR